MKQLNISHNRSYGEEDLSDREEGEESIVPLLSMSEDGDNVEVEREEAVLKIGEDGEEQDPENGNTLNQVRSKALSSNELPSDFDDLTITEKKSLLVTRELNRMGMGKYQWYIWTLCGLGYLLDLLWAQAFGLIAPALQKEMGFSDKELGNLFTAVNAGLTVGALVWGILVDIIGRKWAFNGTVFVAAAFGLSIGGPDSYRAILVLVAFTGFGIGGNIPIDTTIALEFLPENKRFLLALLSIFQPLGVVICSGIAYGFIPKYSCGDLPSCKTDGLPKGAECCGRGNNQGWRYLMFTLGGISFFVFLMRFVVFKFQESPKYLLSKGKDEDALAVLQIVARTNKTTCNLTMEDFAALENAEDIRTDVSDQPDATRPQDGSNNTYGVLREKIVCELKRIGTLLGTKKLARVTLLVWVIYAFDYFGFSISGSFLPTILARKGAENNATLSETYRNFVIIYLPGIVGVCLGAFMVKVPRIGRRWSMICSSALMGTSFFLFAAVNTQAANVGLSAMEYFFQSMFNSVLYGWTPEAFPAPVRGTASGMASCWGRLFSIFSPMIAARILDTSLNGVLFLAGSGTFVATLGILALPDSAVSGTELQVTH